MTQPTNDVGHLVDEYARMIRRLCVAGGEEAFAIAFVDALTNPDSRHSNTRRLQRVRAVTAAARQVRAERLQADALHNGREVVRA